MEKVIKLNDTYMNVITFGKGDKNLVVIAGVSLTGFEGMSEAMERALSVFADDFTVYVFDRKKVLTKGSTIDEMAEDIHTCLTELGVEKTSIYGASQGGMIGQTMAIKYPEMVENLVVCSTICRAKDNCKVADLWIDVAKEHDVEKVNTLFLEYVYSDAFIESIKDRIPELIKNGTASDCDRLEVELEAIKTFDIFDSLDMIKCPVLVICDKNDKVFDYKNSVEIADKLNCDICIYDKYSHAVYDEAPDIKERIVDFIISQG